LPNVQVDQRGSCPHLVEWACCTASFGSVRYWVPAPSDNFAHMPSCIFVAIPSPSQDRCQLIRACSPVVFFFCIRTSRTLKYFGASVPLLTELHRDPILLVSAFCMGSGSSQIILHLARFLVLLRTPTYHVCRPYHYTHKR
jgi:hypothetical protein